MPSLGCRCVCCVSALEPVIWHGRIDRFQWVGQGTRKARDLSPLARSRVESYLQVVGRGRVTDAVYEVDSLIKGVGLIRPMRTGG